MAVKSYSNNFSWCFFFLLWWDSILNDKWGIQEIKAKHVGNKTEIVFACTVVQYSICKRLFSCQLSHSSFPDETETFSGQGMFPSVSLHANTFLPLFFSCSSHSLEKGASRQNKSRQGENTSIQAEFAPSYIHWILQLMCLALWPED